MAFDARFLRSKVALRIFMLFILCALLPVGVLAILSFTHVTRLLHDQGRRQVHRATKALALDIYERLLFLEAQMRVVASNLGEGSRANMRPLSKGFGEDLRPRFKGLAIVRDGGTYLPLFGRVQDPPEPTPAEKRHIGSGKTLISSQHRPDPPSPIFMSRALDPARPERGILVAEVNPVYLWGVGDEETSPPLTEVWVLDPSNKVLMGSSSGPVAFPAQVAEEMRRSTSGQFTWRRGDQEYLASYWSVPLKFAFFAPKWTVVLRESRADVLAPMANFKKTFPLVILLALGVVLLLSISQIRRSLTPLEKLQEGTRRVAMRDFQSRVTVTSGDEFEELAASFNRMAGRLGRQFNALTTMNQIDRAILSVLDKKAIVNTVLARMRHILPCDGVSVTLLDPNGTEKPRTYIGDGNPEGEGPGEATEVTPEDVQRLRENPETFLIVDGQVPPYLAPLTGRGMGSFLLLPIFLGQRLSGIIGLGYRERPALSQEDLVQARQLADQVAVALSNAGLIEELGRLNWGTLTALARAIDAKSHWTAGHSERVAGLALKIGRALGLSPKEVEVLHRGGLLHDIGKLGTPAHILDKSGRLTDEEARLMREHARMGARILEPIAAYADVIPIVLEHHEWYDGTGYPDGLAGEAISLGGRIFAVADCFDALISNRPYRSGLEREHAIEVIKQGAGQQFDPKVVQAFLEVMAQEKGESPDQATHAPPLFAA